VCGKINCNIHEFGLGNIRRISSFSGSSPPEIFVGRHNYPYVNIGILSPQEKGNTKLYSSQELWHEKRLSIPQILDLRTKLIYGRTKGDVKKPLQKTQFLSTMQEIAMTSKSISTEFKLEKPIQAHDESESYIPIIKKAAQVKSVRLEENPQIERKIDYLVNDTDAKSKTSILELEKAKTPVSTIIKILSAGLLGLKTERKLVPTRWSITAVDDMISKEKLKKIKFHKEISNFELFTADYLGNHYEFLLLPDKFSFEVIEINSQNLGIWQDYESFFGRKNYAESVTGAYYANRLALTEYLEKQQKQASCLVFREIGEEYTQSMGVGILRQLSREAFSKQPETFSSIAEALARISIRLKLPITTFTDKSNLLKKYGKQARLNTWFKI
jgi:hypothetical protein